MTKKNVALELSPQPDGFGFFYGQGVYNGKLYMVNILPPTNEWAGDIVLDEYPPHETDWIVYLDGEEFARARRRSDLSDAVYKQIEAVST